ncbi:MAG TPA: serine/threonine-protein kinase [Fimbriiglobus sp.]|nr:serine/threonine-protein kinase [Fimbriiglobus sp.]
MIAPSSKPSSPRAGFLAAVRASGLLSDEQFRSTVAGLPADAQTGRAAAVALVAAGVLTLFQAERLLAGRTGGFVLGPYVILDQIAREPDGQVYQALHRAMGRPVAVKVLSADRGRDLAALRAESRSAAQLAHPNVLTVLDADEYGGRFVLVLEHVEGEGAEAAVRRSGPLAVHRACEVVRQAALGLQHAHEKGVCHGALTPGCLRVGRSAVKVAGFGPGLAGGTDYLAPELFDPAAVPSPRSDLYALGGVLYYLLTGRTPFPALAAEDTLRHHRSTDPVPVEVLRPGVPMPVAALVRELLAKDAAGRPESAGDVAARLDPFGEYSGTVSWGEGYRPGDRDALAATPPPFLTMDESEMGSTLASESGSLADLSPWAGLVLDAAGTAAPRRRRLALVLAVLVPLVLAAALAVIVAAR